MPIFSTLNQSGDQKQARRPPVVSSGTAFQFPNLFGWTGFGNNSRRSTASSRASRYYGEQGKVTNYVLILRNSEPVKRNFFLTLLFPGRAPILGSYVIDPFLHVPSSQLITLPQGEERKNLKMEARNGSINVHVGITAGADVGRGRYLRATLDFVTHANYPITARIEALVPVRPPILLSMKTETGRIELTIPSDFSGFLSVTAAMLNTHVKLSRKLEEQAAIVNEMGTTRNYFIGHMGNLEEAEVRQRNWEGDQIRITTGNGRVKIRFSDESKSKDAPKPVESQQM